MVIIIFIIGAIFLWRFAAMSNSVLNDDSHFAIMPLFGGALIGAILGIISAISNFFNSSSTMGETGEIMLMILFVLLMASIMLGELLAEGIGQILSKGLYMGLCAIMGFLMGYSAAIIVLAILFFVFVIRFAWSAIFGTGETVEVKDQDGVKKTLTNSIGGEWLDAWGRSYKKYGNTFIQDN